jgi:hypothetical protein
MAWLVPAIHVVRLARSPNAQPIGRQQDAKLPCGWTTWMAGTSPVMTDASETTVSSLPSKPTRIIPAKAGMIRRPEEEKKRSTGGMSQRLDCPIADGAWSSNYFRRLVSAGFNLEQVRTKRDGFPYDSLNGPIPICWNFHHICVQRKLTPPREPDPSAAGWRSRDARIGARV